MKEISKKNLLKRRKSVLVFVILELLLLIGVAVWYTVLGIQISQQNIEYDWMLGYFNIFRSPRFYFLIAGVIAVHALIVLPLGIFTYRGKKGAAVALLVFGLLIGLSGYLGAIAAMIVLVKPRKQ